MFAWGISNLFAKGAVSNLGKERTMVAVNIMAIIVMMPLLYVVRDAMRFDLAFFGAILFFGCLDFIAYLTLYKAYEIGKLSIIAPIVSGYAVVTLIVSAVFFGEPFTPAKIVMLILVIIGILLMSVDLAELRNGFSKNDLAKGVPHALFLLIFYGIYIPIWDKFIDDKNWVIVSTSVRLASVVIAVIAFKGIRRINLKIESKRLILLVIAVGLFEAVGTAGFNWGLSNSLDTSVTAALASAYPLVVLVGAYTFLQERIAPNQYLGMILIVTGVVLGVVI